MSMPERRKYQLCKATKSKQEQKIIRAWVLDEQERVKKRRKEDK